MQGQNQLLITLSTVIGLGIALKVSARENVIADPWLILLDI